jgi:translation initiation factor 3 subunit B
LQGKFIVLAGLKNINGQLEFYNVDELETMATGEHYMATDVDWDPTGRSDPDRLLILKL